jgi:hypothetical protein
VFCTEAVRFLSLCFFIEPLVAPLSGMGFEPPRVPHIIEKSELRCTAGALPLEHQLAAWTLRMHDISR